MGTRHRLAIRPVVWQTGGGSDEYEEAPSPYGFGQCSRILLVGKSGSGKTTAIHQLVANPKLLPPIRRLVFVTPTEHDYQPIADAFAEKLGPEVASEMVQIINPEEDGPPRLENLTDPGRGHHLVVFDDCIRLGPEVQRLMGDAAVRGRRTGSTFVFVTQALKEVSTTMRGQMSHLLIFPSGMNSQEMHNVRRICPNDMDPAELRGLLLRVAKVGRFHFLLLDLTRDAGDPLARRCCLDTPL